jgi:hypothetical protein
MAIKKPLSSTPPRNLMSNPVPVKRLPTQVNTLAPNAPKPVKPKPASPSVIAPNKPPSLTPQTQKPPSLLSRAGGAFSGLASGAGMIGLGALATGTGSGGLGGLFGAGLQTGGNVAIASKGIDAVKDVVNNAIGSLTGNPVNLAIVAGVLGIVLFGLPKFR